MTKHVDIEVEFDVDVEAVDDFVRFAANCRIFAKVHRIHGSEIPVVTLRASPEKLIDFSINVWRVNADGDKSRAVDFCAIHPLRSR